MIAAFRRLVARSRLIKARRELEAARREHKAACARRDSRSIHAATARLQAAKRAELAAEIVARPIPYPMPRHGAASQGN
jgi:hypothetical protein